MRNDSKQVRNASTPTGGLAGWLLARLRGDARPRPRLSILERVSLAPRQSLSLIEVEGRRLLVATSADGSPAFYSLDGRGGEGAMGRKSAPSSRMGMRSW